MPGMEDCWHAGVRPGMAIRETDSELGLRTAGGGGLRTRQAGRVKFPGLAVLHSPARRGYRAHPGAGHRDGPRPRSAAGGGLRGRGPGRLAGHAGRLPSALPGPRPGSGAARGRYDLLRGAWRLPGAGTDISVTADYRDDHRPRPDSGVWTFHAIRPR